MKKQITYFDPRVTENDPGGELMTVIATSQEEMGAIMAAITNPERGITNISEWEDVPPTADDLIAELDELDLKIIRPMAAIVEGSATTQDRERFDELMAKKNEFRLQITEKTTSTVGG